MATQECVVCTRTASIFCDQCAILEESGRPLEARWYCTALCRESDKPSHAPNCFNVVDHQGLLVRAQRAGELAQALFYTFVEQTWSCDMSSVRIIPNKDGELGALEVIHGPGRENGPGGESVCEQQAGGWLTRFPEELFKFADHKAKNVLLADQQSIWVFIIMQATVHAVFQGKQHSTMNCLH